MTPTLAAIEQVRHAAVGALQTEQDGNRGGFSGAIRPQEGKQFAGLNPEVQAIEAQIFPKRLLTPRSSARGLWGRVVHSRHLRDFKAIVRGIR